MFSRRDATGSITNVKQSRYLEPSASTEAAFTVPREQNIHLNTESIRVTGDPKTPFHRRDPSKVYTSAPYVAANQKPRRQLPTPPSAKERKQKRTQGQNYVHWPTQAI
eukprot:TRINITY_DN9773_c0_g3_i1.p2 TRINITY_DN9773_c0_g3~~TRINITY_DN9773_c0_g3_i1.p2  ORF type:complete len:108 (+),score=12.16 TRINITY_DN9773_c0_g3_i1:134-457(+)